MPTPASARPARLPTAQVIAAIGGICMAQSLVSGIAFQGVPTLLRDRGTPLDQIGLAHLAFLPWALKFLWSPLVERYRLPSGRAQRRTRRIVLPGQWLLAALLFLLAGLGQPALPALLGILGLISLTAATVDIAGDAFAVEQLAENRRGWGNATQVGSSYLGMFLGAGLFVILAGSQGWSVAAATMGGLVLLLTLPFARVREPARQAGTPAHRPSLAHALGRPNVRLGLAITVVFQAGARLAYGMTPLLLLDRGVPLATVGWISGAGTVGAGLAGTLLGALLLKRCGAARAIGVALALQTLALAAFLAAVVASSRLPQVGPSWLVALALLKAATVAIGFVALYAFLMGQASPAQAGVDFTLFQCADAMVATIGGVAAGWLAQHLGYDACFGAAAALGAAGLALIPALLRRLPPPLPGEPT
ncbi:MAG: MFS transporter [Achromobacter sp.]|uniref:MFS transporter n=1 Tax=Achromobacter sp. TaxID=134375 RepID=UPI003CFE5030